MLINFVLAAILLLLTLVAGSTQVTAQAPQRFYDWSSTLDTTTPTKVLGAMTPAADYQKFSRYLIGANLTPATPLYFLKTIQENFQLLATSDPQNRANLRLQIAGQRLAEMEILTQANQFAALPAATSGYSRALSQTFSETERLDQTEDFTTRLELLLDEVSKHNLILEKSSAALPDDTKPSIKNAIEANWTTNDQVADLLVQPALPADLVSRIQDLKAQGLLTEEEASKLISVKSRREARGELLKYVNEGVIPTSDFLILNDRAKKLFPDEFYKIHEIKRFQELIRLESDKPDDATLAKIQLFAKTYRPGSVVPAEIRKYWVPLVRLEEIQNTLRPDLIDEDLFLKNPVESQKFTELVQRFKPRPEDLANVISYLKKYQVEVVFLSPEYQRLYNLGQKYGAQCGFGLTWVALPASPGGGVCVPDDKLEGLNLEELSPRNNRNCAEALSPAKNISGACSVYPTNCLPPGWTKVESCTQLPPSTSNTQGLNCAPNTHFVSISYMPNGGYCLPNYTKINILDDGGLSCTIGYHRSYQGGPCLPNYNPAGTIISLPPITSTPGLYPNPIYPTFGSCGPGTHWVSGLTDPKGGYCVRNDCSPPQNGCGQNGFYDYKNCRCLQCSPGRSFSGVGCEDDPGVTTPANQSLGPYDCPTRYCGGGANFFDHGSCTCRSCSAGRIFNGVFCQNVPGGSTSTAVGGPFDCGQTNTVSCGGGSNYYDVASCSCKKCPSEDYSWSGVGCTYTPNRPPPGVVYCPEGQYYSEYKTCVPVSQSTTTSKCAVVGSCWAGTSWDPTTCTCKPFPPGSTPAPTPTPQKPSGGCPYQTIWNGYACVWDSGPTPTPTPPPVCPGGSHWNGVVCVRDDGGGILSCPQGTSWNGHECASTGDPSYVPPTVAPGSSCFPPQVVCSGGVGCCLYPTATPAPQPTNTPAPQPTDTPAPIPTNTPTP